MRREFTLQLHDAVNPDECTRGDCEGPCPVIRPLPWTLTQCVACARRRLGIGHGRMSAWWPAHMALIQGKRIEYIICDDILDEP